MEATGVLPFVRGVDLSGNDFKVSPGPPLGGLFRSSPHLSPLPVPSASGPSTARGCWRGRVGLPQGSGSPPRTDPQDLFLVPAQEDRGRVGPAWTPGFEVTLGLG